jgi:hypothetical protein
MPSARELNLLAQSQNYTKYIQQVESRQDYQSSLAGKIIRIGKRDIYTGKHEVIHPNNAITINGNYKSNTSIRYGSQVRASTIASSCGGGSNTNSDGLIILASKNRLNPFAPIVEPVRVRYKPKLTETVKVLLGYFEGDDVVYAIGGDRPPEEIYRRKITNLVELYQSPLFYFSVNPVVLQSSGIELEKYLFSTVLVDYAGAGSINANSRASILNLGIETRSRSNINSLTSGLFYPIYFDYPERNFYYGALNAYYQGAGYWDSGFHLGVIDGIEGIYRYIYMFDDDFLSRFRREDEDIIGLPINLLPLNRVLASSIEFTIYQSPDRAIQILSPYGLTDYRYSSNFGFYVLGKGSRSSMLFLDQDSNLIDPKLYPGMLQPYSASLFHYDFSNSCVAIIPYTFYSSLQSGVIDLDAIRARGVDLYEVSSEHTNDSTVAYKLVESRSLDQLQDFGDLHNNPTLRILSMSYWTNEFQQ